MFGTKEREPDARPHAAERTDSKAKQLVTLVVAIGVPLLVVLLMLFTQFKQLNDPDVMEMAVVARNISAGHGFSTSAVRPLAVTLSKNVMHMPDMIHGPLYPYAMALVFGANAGDRKVFATSALFFLLTIPVLYALAKGMFNTRVARFTILAYVTSMFMMNMLVAAGTGTMLGFFFTAMCLVLFRYAQHVADATPEAPPNKRRTLILAGGAGVLMALAYLTDYMIIFAIVPVAAYVYLAGGSERKRGLLSFLIGFAVPALPWMLLHNLALTGHAVLGLRALEIAAGTTEHSGLSIYRTTEPTTLLSVLQDTKGELFRKLAQGVANAYQSFPSLGQPYLMPFFLVGLFYSFRRAGVNALRGMVVASFLFVLVFASLFVFSTATVAAFVPIILAFSAAYFIRLVTDMKSPTIVIKGVMVAAVTLLILPLLTMLVLSRAPAPADRSVETDLSRRIRKDTPILTDKAFEVAWYGNRTTIWLPVTEKDVENLNKVRTLKAIFLSADLHPSQRTAENFDMWRVLYGQAYNSAVQGKFARLSTGPLRGFWLFRDMGRDDVIKYLEKGNLLFTRPDATRLPAAE